MRICERVAELINSHNTWDTNCHHNFAFSTLSGYPEKQVHFEFHSLVATFSLSQIMSLANITISLINFLRFRVASGPKS